MQSRNSTKRRKIARNDVHLIGKALSPYLVQTAKDWNPSAKIKLKAVENPMPNGTLGYVGPSTEVKGPPDFQISVLIQPFAPRWLLGIDPDSVRVFRYDNDLGSFKPVWDSGIVLDAGIIWTKIRRPGIYAPIGLPRDRVISEMLRNLAIARRYTDTDSKEEGRKITRNIISEFLEWPDEDLAESQRLIAKGEIHSRLASIPPQELKLGRHGGHIQSLRLPRDETLSEFKERLSKLEPAPSGLPEEALFFKPEIFQAEPPWPLRQGTWPSPYLEADESNYFYAHNPRRDRSPCWRRSKDWYMYHHDIHHSGIASGCSNISSRTISSMILRSTVALDGPVNSIPSVVHGKIYVGTIDSNTHAGGTLYKIDLHTGNIEGTYQTIADRPAYSPGIGGSPAIVGGKVYFTAVPGRVYCLDSRTLAEIWVTDLRNADLSHNQPVQNDNADSWSSPLVVNGKVYVGCGEGENDAFGFVYCLNAHNGHVIWLYCTDKFSRTVQNEENIIPASAVPGPLPPSFRSHADPPVKGASVWSSCAYDRSLNRIYVGTGNSTAGNDNPLPDAYYGSGVLSLDASSGEFRGFFEPSANSSYRVDPEGDTDVDVPSSPLLFKLDGKTILGLGSKNGSFFLLDAKTMRLISQRQLLPNDAISHNPLPNVDPHPGARGENYYGIFGTAAVNYDLGAVFVGIGGYAGGIDTPTTPFMRALHWRTLDDLWLTSTDAVGTNNVDRYSVPRPPMYTTTGEAGLSSPAVVNDVVFVSTSAPGFYAFDSATGLRLWTATGLGLPSLGTYMLGPAIYGNYVVIGSNNGNLYIYSLP